MVYLDWGIWTLIAAGTPALLLIVYVFRLLRRPYRVDLYQHGIDYQVGRRHEYLFWNQIYEVYQTPRRAIGRPAAGGNRVVGWSLRLVRRDGRRLRLSRLESIHGLGQRVQTHVLRRHLPLALDAYRAGYAIRFGRYLTVSRDGVRWRRKLLTWEEIAEIRIDEVEGVRVRMRRAGAASKRLAIRHVPNLLLLDSILRAGQELRWEDPLDVARRRSAWLDDDPSSSQLPLPAEDTSASRRPRHPK
jgi:hypothetical protein